MTTSTADQLRQLPIFAALSAEQAAVIARMAAEKQCAAGQVLFQVGDKAQDVFLLLSGEVAIQARLASQPDHATIAILNQPGQVVGWSGLLAPTHYTAQAVCQTNTTLLAISGAGLMAAMERDSQMGFVIMRHLAEVISSRLRNIQQVVMKTL